MTANPDRIFTEVLNPVPDEDVWSYSRLSTFERCEREFFYKYRERRLTPANMPMIMREIFAQAMEWILKEGYESEEAVRNFYKLPLFLIHQLECCISHREVWGYNQRGCPLILWLAQQARCCLTHYAVLEDDAKIRVPNLGKGQEC